MIGAEFRLLRPQDAYDINQLRHPTELAALRAPLGRPPLRRDAPFSRVRPQPPRMLPTSPADIADFINDVGAPGGPQPQKSCGKRKLTSPWGILVGVVELGWVGACSGALSIGHRQRKVGVLPGLGVQLSPESRHPGSLCGHSISGFLQEMPRTREPSWGAGGEHKGTSHYSTRCRLLAQEVPLVRETPRQMPGHKQAQVQVTARRVCDPVGDRAEMEVTEPFAKFLKGRKQVVSQVGCQGVSSIPALRKKSHPEGNVSSHPGQGLLALVCLGLCPSGLLCPSAAPPPVSMPRASLPCAAAWVVEGTRGWSVQGS